MSDPKLTPSSNRMEGPDFGAFSIAHPDEPGLLPKLWELAAQNTQFPGTAHLRMVANHPQTGAPLAIKSFHLDLHRRVLVILEERGGELAARKTIPLSPEPEEDPNPPALDPGPSEPRFVREPFAAADMEPDDELREWSMAQLNELLPGLAAIPTCIGCFRPGSQDAYTPASPLLPTDTAQMGALLARLRLRPGVQRTLVEGWTEAGPAIGMAFVVERCESEAWWVALRPFTRRAGPMGEWSAPWTAIEGEGPARFPVALRELLWPPAGVAAPDPGEPQVVEPGEMEVEVGEIDPGQPLPSTAPQFAEWAARPLEAAVLANKGLHPPRLVVLRGRTLERWKLDGPLPTDVDDLIRNVCRRSEEPTAVVLSQFAVVPLSEGKLAKCLLTVAETANTRHTRAMELRADASGRIVGARFLQIGNESEDRWIGVEPITELSAVERSGAGEA